MVMMMMMMMRDHSIPGIIGVLEELPLSGEDNKSNICIAQHGDLVRLLEQPRSPLREGHLSVDLVLYPLQHNPTSPHTLLHTLSVYPNSLHRSTLSHLSEGQRIYL